MNEPVVDAGADPLIEKLVLDCGMAGKSFLHVAGNSRHYVDKAASQGAQAVALTLDRDVLGRSGDKNNSAERYVRCDPEREEILGTYDIVLCCGSLHQARNPLSVLDKLIAATRETLILQLTLREGSILSRDRSIVGKGVLQRMPALFLAPWKRKHGVDQSFYMTEAAAVALLKTLRQDFARVEVHRSGTLRPVIVARKRRIEHLHIIAGVNAIGKSTLLDKLRLGKQSEVADQMRIDLSKPWYFTTYAHLLRETDETFDFLVAQYNITAPLVHGTLHGNHHGLQDLIQSAKHVDVTTMWLSPEEQRKRYHADRVPDKLFSPELYKRRKIAKLRDVHGRTHKAAKENPLRGMFYVRSAYTRRKAGRLLDIYGDRQTYLNMYDDWFDFLDHLPVEARVLYQQPEYHAVSIDEWRQRELA